LMTHPAAPAAATSSRVLLLAQPVKMITLTPGWLASRFHVASAAHDGHLQVHEHHVWVHCVGDGHHLDTVCALIDDEDPIGLVQQCPNSGPNQRVVIDDHYPDHHFIPVRRCRGCRRCPGPGPVPHT